jgi:hypothetical protein
MARTRSEYWDTAVVAEKPDEDTSRAVPTGKYEHIGPRYIMYGRLCGLVVRVSGCRPRGPGSIPGVPSFSE